MPRRFLLVALSWFFGWQIRANSLPFVSSKLPPSFGCPVAAILREAGVDPAAGRGMPHTSGTCWNSRRWCRHYPFVEFKSHNGDMVLRPWKWKPSCPAGNSSPFGIWHLTHIPPMSRSSFSSMPSAQEFCWDWWLANFVEPHSGTMLCHRSLFSKSNCRMLGARITKSC